MQLRRRMAQVKKEEEEDFPIEEDPKEGSSIKVPPQGGLSILQSPKKSSEGKKFEDYTYAYGGAEKPQLATATALPQAYEEALTVMWQSL